VIRLIGPAVLVVAVWLGWQATESVYPQDNPRLATLDIAIWPEFDRPAALVILRAEIAEDVTSRRRLCASNQLGGPAALAYAASADGQLLNLGYQRSDAQDFITLTFSTPERFFQVEFYDPIAVGTTDRSYTYTWPGDLAADKLSVELQEPATATGLSVQPELGAGQIRPDGLTYHQVDLGAFDAGQTLAIDVSYQKTESRTSAESLRAQFRGRCPSGWWPRLCWRRGRCRRVLRRRGAVSSYETRPRATRAARRREQAAGQRESGANFCPQCGAALRSRDRFCPECGTAVRRS
jgi:ribosomal protein L32